jgi:hypothetical protein
VIFYGQKQRILKEAVKLHAIFANKIICWSRKNLVSRVTGTTAIFILGLTMFSDG